MIHYGIQWHVTARCDQRCLHCYVYDKKTYESELAHELSKEECFKIVDKIYAFKRKLKKYFRDDIYLSVSFTGGDPLLRPDFFDILSYARKKFDYMTILGNSYHLDEGVIQDLARMGIRKYQISVDGMKPMHDKIRRKGSFDDAFRGLRLLKEGGIRENIMMTLSPLNSRDLLPLIRFAAKKNVTSFAFARMARFGNGKLHEKIFTPSEYRKILLGYVKERQKLALSGYRMRLTYKDHLIKLLLSELGIFSPREKDNVYGCHMIKRHMTILSDGTVLACRRFYDKIGQIKKDNLFDIYSSPGAQKYLDFSNFIKCKNCFLVKQCRGCPAVAFGETGNSFGPDPQCWKK